jgi:hypothetical protein
MYHKNIDHIDSITCDFCLDKEFFPELQDGDDTDEAMEQAEDEGWKLVREGTRGLLHCCPDCAEKMK